ncbi:hypothetical protein ACFY9S_16965 [Streptomyces sp. NPDC012474]|uniref:hypothetical protein n=1 Tax=Streptomyces sp. NPDC012474 TaxID=3364836 RepID=UPI0036EDAB9D
MDDDSTTPGGGSLLDEIVREGARRMPVASLEAEPGAVAAELADGSVPRRRRAVNAPRLVALVPAGGRFEPGRFVERPEAVAA